MSASLPIPLNNRLGARAQKRGVAGAIARWHRRTWSLKQRLMLLVLSAILPIIIVSGFFVAGVAQQFLVMHGERLQHMLVDAHHRLSHDVTAVTELARVLAEDTSIDARFDPGALTGRLVHEARAGNVELALIGLDGRRIAGSDAGPDEPIEPRNLRAALDGSEPVVLNARPARGQDPPALRVLAPVLRDGVRQGVLEVVLPPARMASAMDVGEPPGGGGYILADPSGLIVAASPGGPGQVGMGLPRELRRDMAATESILTTVVWPDRTEHAVAHQQVELAPAWSLSVWERAQERASVWIDPVIRYVVLTTLSVLLGILAAAALAGRLVQPLEGLTQHARAVAEGREAASVPVPVSQVAEFESLRIALARAELVLRHRAATERRARRDARDRQQLLASVIAGSADGITVKGLDGHYVLANRAAMSIMCLDEPPSQLIGKCAGDLLPAEISRRVARLDSEVAETGGSRSTEIEWPLTAGDVRYVWLVKSPWHDDAGHVTGVVTLMRDVTEQRRDEARIHGVQGNLAQASRLSAMGVMASGLAHDLNQPLAAASNFLGAARRLMAQSGSRPEAAEAACDAVDEAVGQVLRAGRIVNALRAFLADGRCTLVPTELNGLLEEACAVARADGSLGVASLSLTVAADVAEVMADRTQMQQVVLNMIRNAAEAIAEQQGPAPSGGTGHIAVAAVRDADGWVRTSVTDTGPGLQAEVVQRLFEPFVSTKRAGLGIGLAICNTIVAAHGGRMEGGPAPGGGARFSFALPPLPSQSEERVA